MRVTPRIPSSLLIFYHICHRMTVSYNTEDVMAVTPYTKQYINIKDVSKYFKYNPEKHTITFTGDSLVIHVPKRLEAYNLLHITDVVETVGVMDLIIDDTYQATLHMLAGVKVAPTEIATITVNNVPYLKMTLVTGNLFTTSTTVIKNKNIMYACYVEFVTRGNIPYTMGYDDLFSMFDQAGPMCGSKLPVDHAIFEVIFAHLSRNPDNRFQQYRHTDMTKPFEFIALRDVAYAPTSTNARLLGSYMDDGLNAALINVSEERQPFEDILRGIPLEEKADNE